MNLCIFLLLLCPSVYFAANNSNLNSIASFKSSSFSSSSDRNFIVGGEKVKWGEAPWQVAIFERDDAHDKFCGGALIGPRTVLTAAHCIDKGEENYPNHFVVRYGTLDFTKGADVFVARVNRHPNYDPVTHQNDIATLILAGSFSEGDNAGVIGLPDLNDTSTISPPVGANLQLTGWGHLQAGDGQLSTWLMRASGLVVVDGEECVKRWAAEDSTVKIDPTKVVCAEDRQKSACFGDSGGPVVMLRTSRDGNGAREDAEVQREQVGVISLSTRVCSSSSAPNVYTSVAAYRDWIRANSGAEVLNGGGGWIALLVLSFFLGVLLFFGRS